MLRVAIVMCTIVVALNGVHAQDTSVAATESTDVQERDSVSPALGGLAYMLYFLSIITPSEIGTDVSTAAGGEPRLRLGWAYQIPFAIFSARDWADGRDPMMRHRIVLAVRLGFGRRTVGEETERLTADVRYGYRYRFAHAGRVAAPYVGFGSTIDGWPERRSSFSLEGGVHLGRDHAFRPGATLGLQVDYFPRGEPLRVMLLAGWTLW